MKTNRAFVIELKDKGNCFEITYSLEIDGHCELLKTTYWLYPKGDFDISKPPLYDNGVVYGFLTALGYDANEELSVMIATLPEYKKVVKEFLPVWEKEDDGHVESV